MARQSKNADPLFGQFREIILIQLGLDEMPDLKQDLAEIKDLDQLDITEMVMDCEAVFGIEVDDEHLADLRNLEQVWRLIQKKSQSEQKIEAATA